MRRQMTLGDLQDSYSGIVVITTRERRRPPKERLELVSTSYDFCNERAKEKAVQIYGNFELSAKIMKKNYQLLACHVYLGSHQLKTVGACNYFVIYFFFVSRDKNVDRLPSVACRLKKSDNSRTDLLTI